MQKSISLSVFVLIILLPLNLPLFDGAFQAQEIIVCSCCLLMLSLFALCVCLAVRKKRICLHFSVLDLSVFLFFAYSVLHLCFIKHLHVGEAVIYKWLSLFFVYVLCRMLTNKSILLYSIVLSGILQSAVAILQKLYLIDANNSFFDVTGTFSNPGVLGGYLAVAFTVSAHLLRKAAKNKSRIRMLFLCIALLITGIALVLADSRAAFTGVFFGIMICFYSEIRSIFIKHKIVFAAIFLIIVVVSGLFLFNYRKDSALSRLLIWRISADMICDKPLTGHGITSFEQKYMLYQAEYFAKNEDSKFVSIADNVPYAYNEFIHISVEMGILGLLLLLFMLYSVFSSGRQFGKKSAFAAFLVFSLFSYPAEIFSLLFLFPVIAAGINTKILKIINLSRTVMIICGFILVCSIYVSLKSELYFRKASYNFREAVVSNEKTGRFIVSHYGRLQYYPEFCKLYVKWFGNNISENELFNVLALFPSSENYCYFGELYFANGMYSKSEQCFETAALMTPNRILPNYGLFRLYQKSGNMAKAAEIAYKIVNQTVKIENTQTIKIRFEAENYLNNNGLHK